MTDRELQSVVSKVLLADAMHEGGPTTSQKRIETGNMYENTARRYQQVQSTTLTPGELLLALYDGMFRFLKRAKLCFENGQMARGREFLMRTYSILSELLIALDRSQAPELCAQLASIYGFCMDRISQANARAAIAPIDEVIRTLTPLKEAWAIAVPEAIRNPAR